MLRDKMPPGGEVLLNEAATVEEVLQVLNIASDQVQAIAVNGRLEVDRKHPLVSDDELTILPPVTGGRS
jgi:molybdopterin converting factor small subunit